MAADMVAVPTAAFQPEPAPSAPRGRWFWDPIAPRQAWLELLGYVTLGVLAYTMILGVGASRFLLTALILPLPVLAPRWPLPVLCLTLLSMLVLAGSVAVEQAPDPAQDLLRLTIQTMVMGAFCLILRGLARAHAADRAALQRANAELAVARDQAASAVRRLMADVDERNQLAAQNRTQREELQRILDAIPALIYFKDAANTILGLNRRAADSIGLAAEEIIGRRTEEFFPPEQAAAYLADDLEVLGSGQPKLGIVEPYSVDGREQITIRTDKIPLRGPSGTFDRLVAVATDITDVVRAQAARARAEERLSLAVNGAQDAIWDWNIETGEAYFAPRWCELLRLDSGCPLTSMSDWRTRIASTSLAAFETALHEHLEGRSETLEVELEMVAGDGESRWMHCRARALRNETGFAIRLAGCVTDISELKSAQQKLLHLADHDHLTGLANRKRLIEQIGYCKARCRREHDYRFALLFLDFDRFKVVNDALGHSVGDALLVAIAARLEYSSRETDLVARFGGDEFVLLLSDLGTPENVPAVCERVLATLSQPYRLEGQEIYSSASIGVVLCDGEDPRDAEALLRDADAAMYVAKSAGRATYRIFDEAMHKKALDAVFIEQALRADPFEREFELYYQPIVEIDNGRIVGFEALVRWNHPELGFIAPDRFIHVAEETGQIVRLGRWVLGRACRQIRAWRAAHPEFPGLYVNVNVSKREMLVPDFVDAVTATIASAGLAPDAIKLEITETAVMTHRAALMPVLDALSDRGISLGLDDFGTGHSSLSALYQFPIGVLKLDRSFIVDLDRAESMRAILAPIVALAGNLNLEVIAEGVETEAQRTQLQAVGCRLAQGYLFARPMDAASATAHLLAAIGTDTTDSVAASDTRAPRARAML
ncbi:MAG: EAL domain-containing protein [Pseudomonadales bacterium]|nr:EAL domain-containing protein [Pseudomonadales bacterium]